MSRKISYGPLLELFLLICAASVVQTACVQYHYGPDAYLLAHATCLVSAELTHSAATWKIIASDIPRHDCR